MLIPFFSIFRFNGQPIERVNIKYSIVSPRKQEYELNQVDPAMVNSITSFMVSDASASKAYIYEANDMKEVMEFPFNLKEQAQSSTYRELLAIHRLVTSDPSYMQKHADSTVVWLTDNFPMTTVIRRGSRVPALQTLVLDIKEQELKYRVNILPIWQRRSDDLLTLADLGSKSTDTDEWSIDPSDFQAICEKFQVQPSVDLFAAPDNTKCTLFYSKLPCDKALGINCFIYKLQAHTTFWACPPVKLIPKALNMILSQPNIKVLFCVPHWIGATFWPLFTDGNKYKTFIKDNVIFNTNFSAKSANCVFLGRKNFNMICFLIII